MGVFGRGSCVGMVMLAMRAMWVGTRVQAILPKGDCGLTGCARKCGAELVILPSYAR